MKDVYWLKVLKWYLYKKRRGTPKWRSSFEMDRQIRRLAPGDIVIDCGANVGEVTRQLAASGATVHAFEPGPLAFSELRKNTFGFSNVVLHNAAVGPSAGEVKLYKNVGRKEPLAATRSSSVFGGKINVSTDDYDVVQMIDLPAFLRNLNQPVRILKMDVEGMEVPLLEAILDRGLMNQIERIFAETHERKIPELAERTAALRERCSREFPGRVNLDWD